MRNDNVMDRLRAARPPAPPPAHDHDALFAQTVAEPGDPRLGSPTPTAKTRSARRWTTRPRILAGGSLGLVAVAAGVVLAFSGSTAPPAFAITTSGDGSLLVHLYHVSGMEAAVQQLDADAFPGNARRRDRARSGARPRSDQVLDRGSGSAGGDAARQRRHRCRARRRAGCRDLAPGRVLDHPRQPRVQRGHPPRLDDGHHQRLDDGRYQHQRRRLIGDSSAPATRRTSAFAADLGAWNQRNPPIEPIRLRRRDRAVARLCGCICTVGARRAIASGRSAVDPNCE